MIKRILMIGFLAIFLVTAFSGCKSSGVLTTVTPAALDATNTIEEVDGEIEAIEPVNEQDQENNLPNGGHQDEDNIDVDHQFEGVE